MFKFKLTTVDFPKDFSHMVLWKQRAGPRFQDFVVEWFTGGKRREKKRMSKIINIPWNPAKTVIKKWWNSAAVWPCVDQSVSQRQLTVWEVSSSEKLPKGQQQPRDCILTLHANAVSGFFCNSWLWSDKLKPHTLLKENPILRYFWK